MKPVNTNSSPSGLRITDMRFVDIDGAPKRCTLIKIMTNQGLTGYGEVRDASSKLYAQMLKSRILGENPCNVDKIFRKIKQFGWHSRQGGGVSGVEIALWDLAGKAYGVPLYQLLGGKFRDEVRVYCDTDVDGRHTGRDMGRAPKKPQQRRDVYSWRYAATGNGRTATGFMSGRGWRPAILNSRRCWVGRNRREVCENAQSSGG